MPAIDALFVAVAAYLIVFAWALIFGRVLTAVRPHVPGLFSPLFDALAAADSAIYNTLRGWTDGAVQPFTALVGRVVATAESLTANPLDFARHAYAAIVRLFEVDIPWAISVAETDAALLFRQAEGAAEGLFRRLEQELAGLAARLAGLGLEIQQVAEAALAHAYDLAHQAETYALGLAREVVGYAESLVGQEAGRAYAAEQAVLDTAKAEVAQVERDLGQAVAQVENDLGGAVQGLEDKLAQARAELEHDISGFESVVKAEIEAVLKSGPWGAAVAAYEGGEAALKADVETLVTLAAAEIRRQLGDVESLRAKYGPVLRGLMPKAS